VWCPTIGVNSGEAIVVPMGAKNARIDSWQLSVATLAQVSQSTHGILRKMLPDEAHNQEERITA